MAPPPSTPTATPAPKPHSSCPAVRFGKNVAAVSASDNSTNAQTITPAMMFCRMVLTHGPNTALSLHSSTRNTVADGSSTPASACTPWVSSPSTWSGLNDTAAATANNAA